MLKSCISFLIALVGWALTATGVSGVALGLSAATSRDLGAAVACAVVDDAGNCLASPVKGDPNDPYHKKDCEDPDPNRAGSGCGWSRSKNSCAGDCNKGNAACAPSGTPPKDPVCTYIFFPNDPTTEQCWCQKG